jgi:hypothetical protein
MVGCTPNSRVSRLRLMVVGLQERQVADKSPVTVPLIILKLRPAPSESRSPSVESVTFVLSGSARKKSS